MMHEPIYQPGPAREPWWRRGPGLVLVFVLAGPAILGLCALIWAFQP